MGKRKIYVLVGPPSVGKSTWIAKNLDVNNIYIISRDDVVDDIAQSYGWTYDDMFTAPPPGSALGDTHPDWGEVVQSPPFMTWQPLSYSNVLAANNEIKAEFDRRVADAANSGKDIVVDMTNMNAGARKGALAAIRGRESEFTKVAVVFPFQGAEDAVKRVSAMRAKQIRAAGGSKTIPPAAMDRMMGSFQGVSPDEGFDEVVEFDNRDALRALSMQDM
jgi:hypothetical protein